MTAEDKLALVILLLLDSTIYPGSSKKPLERLHGHLNNKRGALYGNPDGYKFHFLSGSLEKVTYIASRVFENEMIEFSNPFSIQNVVDVGGHIKHSATYVTALLIKRLLISEIIDHSQSK